MDQKQIQFHLERAIRRINNAGGKVNPKTKAVALPKYPGIKVLGAIDCLKLHHGYKVAE